MAYALLLGLALGFSLTVPPGPMNALIAYRSVRSLRDGVVTGLGAMSSDVALFFLVFGLRSAIDVAPVVRYLYVLGAAVMIVFGIRLLTRSSASAPPESSGLRIYSQAVLLGLSNPFQIVWWLTAGLAFAYLGGVPLFLGLFAAVTVWILVFPYALHVGSRRRPGVARAVAYASSALLLVFAAYFLWLAAGRTI